MSKKKFSLTSDLVQIEPSKSDTNSTNKPSPISAPKSKRVTVTIATTEDFRTEIKTWCAKNNITLSDAFKKSFKLLMATQDQNKEKY